LVELMDPDWYADPLGRFTGRFFDGYQWTDQVSDGGTLRSDPDWPPTLTTDEGEPVEIDRRHGGNRRQINARHEHERRERDRRRPEIVIPRAE